MFKRQETSRKMFCQSHWPTQKPKREEPAWLNPSELSFRKARKQQDHQAETQRFSSTRHMPTPRRAAPFRAVVWHATPKKGAAPHAPAPFAANPAENTPKRQPEPKLGCPHRPPKTVFPEGGPQPRLGAGCPTRQNLGPLALSGIVSAPLARPPKHHGGRHKH